MNAGERLSEFQDEQLEIFFEGEKSEDLNKIWNTKEWKEVRNEYICEDTVCEWCGSNDGPFHPHHTVKTNWSREWVKTCHKAFVESSSFESDLVEDRYECPECGLRSYYKRETKEPPYRCTDCSTVFQSPEKVTGKSAIKNSKYDIKPYTTPQYYEKLIEWLESNADKVRSKYKERLLNNYLNSNEIVVICASCHYNEEKTNNIRCKNCGTFHKPNKELCWDCLVKEKGLERCSNCNNGWYSPEKYDMCSNCR